MYEIYIIFKNKFFLFYSDKKKCFGRIPGESQMNLLTQMSSFNTKDEQDVFIQGLIHAIPV